MVRKLPCRFQRCPAADQRAGNDGGEGGGAERKSDQTLRDSSSASMRTTTLLTFPHCSVVSQLTDEELEKMRATKAALSALIQRVAKVRQELEETLDDDQDMLVRIIEMDSHLPHSDLDCPRKQVYACPV